VQFEECLKESWFGCETECKHPKCPRYNADLIQTLQNSTVTVVVCKILSQQEQEQAVLFGVIARSH